MDVNMYFRLKCQTLQHKLCTGHYQYFSSKPEECFEVDTNKDGETDPDWTLINRKSVDIASPVISLDIKENKE